MSETSVKIDVLRFRQVRQLARLFSAALDSDFTYIDDAARQTVRRQNSSRHLLIAYLRPRRHILVAMHDTEMIGYVIAGTEADGSGNIDWLYVKQGIRGANIGLRLLTQAMKRLHLQGAEYVTLETYAYTKYYGRQGFRVMRRVTSNGIEQDLMRYDF